MGKLQLKQHLQSITQKQVIDIVLQLYDAKKEAKEWLDYYLQPDEITKLEKYKKIIHEEFYPSTRSTWSPKTRFAVCRKAISDFMKLQPRDEYLAELMVFYVETGCRFTYDYGDMWEQFYDVFERNFEATMKFLQKNNLIERFQPNLDNILKYSKDCGWGFSDAIKEIYYEYTH